MLLERTFDALRNLSGCRFFRAREWLTAIFDDLFDMRWNPLLGRELLRNHDLFDLPQADAYALADRALESVDSKPRERIGNEVNAVVVLVLSSGSECSNGVVPRGRIVTEDKFRTAAASRPRKRDLVVSIDCRKRD